MLETVAFHFSRTYQITKTDQKNLPSCEFTSQGKENIYYKIHRIPYAKEENGGGAGGRQEAGRDCWESCHFKYSKLSLTKFPKLKIALYGSFEI